MAYYKDLDPCGYFDRPPYIYGFKKLYAIGWIDKGQPYKNGKVSRKFIEKLKELINNPHVGMPYMGYHRCFLCSEFLGDDELFVVGKNKIYACPDSMDHYIEKHEYRPPQEFIDAVMNTKILIGEDYKNRIKEIDERVYHFLQPHEERKPWDKEWEKIRKKIRKIEEKKRIEAMSVEAKKEERQTKKIRKRFKKGSFSEKVGLLSQYFT